MCLPCQRGSSSIGTPFFTSQSRPINVVSIVRIIGLDTIVSTWSAIGKDWRRYCSRATHCCLPSSESSGSGMSYSCTRSQNGLYVKGLVALMRDIVQGLAVSYEDERRRHYVGQIQNTVNDSSTDVSESKLRCTSMLEQSCQIRTSAGGILNFDR